MKRRSGCLSTSAVETAFDDLFEIVRASRASSILLALSAGAFLSIPEDAKKSSILDDFFAAALSAPLTIFGFEGSEAFSSASNLAFSSFLRCCSAFFSASLSAFDVPFAPLLHSASSCAAFFAPSAAFFFDCQSQSHCYRRRSEVQVTVAASCFSALFFGLGMQIYSC